MPRAFGIRLWVLIVWIVGLAVLVEAGLRYPLHSRLAKDGAFTRGSVVRVRFVADRHNRTTQAVVTYRYVVDGVSHVGRYSCAPENLPSIWEGDEIPVRYCAGEPGVSLPGFVPVRAGTVLFAMVAGAVLLAAGGILAAGDVLGKNWLAGRSEAPADEGRLPSRTSSRAIRVGRDKNGFPFLSYRWLNGKTWGQLMKEAFFVAVVLTVYSTRSCPNPSSTAVLMDAGFLLLAGLVALHAVMLAVNRTVATVTWNQLDIRHLPVPWPGGISLPADAVKMLAVEEELRPVGRSCGIPIGEPARMKKTGKYVVRAVLRTGKHEVLVGRIETREQARFIADQLAGFLNVSVVRDPSPGNP